MTNDIEVETEGRTFQELSYEECMRRLATRSVGRLAVVVGHYPQVFLVNYRLDDFIVVFRTHAGTKLGAANHANVGFQVDHIDEATRSGWSVLIQGMAEDVTDRVADLVTERSRDLGVEPWVPGENPRFVRIIPALITGRELIPAELALWSDNLDSV
jgi:nitroimidazol reductase NimA-like FMN-containing flavoprotein (pyridoxamine 5'-phosphate oxidase superfamily)